MLLALEFLCALLTAVAMGLALAHALELPGKLRLDREQYLTIQAIYYPGFTIGGAAEPLAIIALATLLLLLPNGSATWLIGTALVAATVTQILFWTVVQPVNRHWLGKTRLGPAGQRFFDTGASSSGAGDWRRRRDRWERGHLARTVTATVAFVLTIVAMLVR